MSDEVSDTPAAPATERPGRPGDPALPVQPYLFEAVFSLERAVTRIGNLRLRPWNVTFSSYAAMRALRRRPNLSLVQLAELCFVRPQSMTRMISDLEQRGLVVRGENPRSKLALSLSLSDRGIEELRRMETEVAGINEAVTNAMTKSQASELEALMRACADIIRAQIDEAESR